MRDMAGENKPVKALTNATINADVNGATVDLGGFNGALIVANVGVSGATLNGTNTIELEVEESVDGAVWTDAPDNSLTTAVTGTNPGTFALIDDAAEDDAVYSTAYIGDKRYIRVVVNFSGTHAVGTPIGAEVVKGYPTFAPV